MWWLNKHPAPIGFSHTSCFAWLRKYETVALVILCLFTIFRCIKKLYNILDCNFVGISGKWCRYFYIYMAQVHKSSNCIFYFNGKNRNRKIFIVDFLEER